MKKTPLSNQLIKILRDGNTFQMIYYHIFSCMDLENLEKQLEWLYSLREGEDSYYKESGKDNWFYVFHKALRQTDFFDSFYREETVEPFTKEERSQWNYLRDKVRTKGYDKNSDKKGELFKPEYKEYLSLSEKWRTRNRPVSLGGHLDMILWNAVHEDGNTLCNSLEQLFEEYKDGF